MPCAASTYSWPRALLWCRLGVGNGCRQHGLLARSRSRWLWRDHARPRPAALPSLRGRWRRTLRLSGTKGCSWRCRSRVGDRRARRSCAPAAWPGPGSPSLRAGGRTPGPDRSLEWHAAESRRSAAIPNPRRNLPQRPVRARPRDRRVPVPRNRSANPRLGHTRCAGGSRSQEAQTGAEPMPSGAAPPLSSRCF